jgi:GR25 family glycosyltransferase involved in LPS biosynthesis
MKLIFYNNGEKGEPHHKIFASIQRMCKSHNIEFEFIQNPSRLYQQRDFDLLICNNEYINPEDFPDVKIVYSNKFLVFPEDILTSPYNEKLKNNCCYNTLANWNTIVHKEMFENFLMDFVELPYGIDVDTFQPVKNINEKTHDCLIYFKDRDPQLLEDAIKTLKNRGLSYLIIHYRHYQEYDYKDHLDRCKFMIVIGRHESQGFAIEEAMAKNIPLLVLDCESMYDEVTYGEKVYEKHKQNNKNLLATAVPYWSNECGIKITKIDELNKSLDVMTENLETYRPRDYILKTLTDSICMERILNYFNLKSPIPIPSLIDSIPIYVINYLDDNRRLKMLERFEKINLKPTFTPPVFKEDPRLEFMNSCSNQDPRTNSIMLQHLDSIRHFYENTQSNYCIICEDDILLHKDLKKLLPSIIKDFDTLNLDVMLLGYLIFYGIYTPDHIHHEQIAINSDNTDFTYKKYPDDIWGAQMYLISRKNAQQLLDKYDTQKFQELPYNPDWTLTKHGNRAMLYPLLALEEGDVKCSHEGQYDFHKRCFIMNYNGNFF